MNHSVNCHICSLVVSVITVNVRERGREAAPRDCNKMLLLTLCNCYLLFHDNLNKKIADNYWKVNRCARFLKTFWSHY